MISVTIKRNSRGKICGFTVSGHGDASLVCPSVSFLTLNTANSLEALTDERFTCEYDPQGGYLKVALPQGPGKDANLLLESMALGLYSLKETYSDDIEIKDDNYVQN